MKATSLIILLSFALGCGTRDYPPSPGKDDGGQATTRGGYLESQTLERKFGAKEAEVEDVPEGYLWEGMHWIGVPQESIEEFKTKLANDHGTNLFTAFGSTVIGGAVLGMVLRGSGSIFLGAPSTSKAAHPFWNKVDRTVKSMGKGIIRGSTFAGACHLILAGVDPLPWDGILGSEFTALSSAIALGTTAAVTSSHIVREALSQDWSQPDNMIGRLLGRSDRSRNAAEKFEAWSKDTDFARGVRYTLIPGIIVVGIGAGVGVIVFDSLQHDIPRPHAR